MISFKNYSKGKKLDEYWDNPFDNGAYELEFGDVTHWAASPDLLELPGDTDGTN